MDNFAEQLLKKKTDSRDKAKMAGIIVLALVLVALTIVLTIATHMPFILIITCAIIYGAWFLLTSQSVEYEYAFTNGEFDIDKIIAKRKRNHLVTVEVKDFTAFGLYTEDIPEDEERTLVLCVDNTGVNEYYADLENEEYGRMRILFSPNETMVGLIHDALPAKLRLKKD